MTAAERGFLLLCCQLGDPTRKCLTSSQFRQLVRMTRDKAPNQPLRQLQSADLVQLGCGAEQARWIMELLDQDVLLEAYLHRCSMANCGVMTRISPPYPQALRSRLGSSAPESLWYKGDLSILDGPKAALVGSRNIRADNAEFAWEAGRQAALQGFTLVSGNARGADRIAQDAALQAGGRVISILPDSLTEHSSQDRVLYLSEDGFDLPFSTARALSRNRLIHALPHLTLVAQCSQGTGGTWSGTVKNLRNEWSKVACFDDHSETIRLLSEMGAVLIQTEQLSDLTTLSQTEPNLFEY